jgi:hypothetical protein
MMLQLLPLNHGLGVRGTDQRLNPDPITEERECQIVTIPLVEMKIFGKTDSKVPEKTPHLPYAPKTMRTVKR